MASTLSSSSPTPLLLSPAKNAEANEPKLECDTVADHEGSEEPQSSSSFFIEKTEPLRVISDASTDVESDDHRVERPAFAQDDPHHSGHPPRKRKSLPRVPPSKRPGALSGHLPISIYTPPNPILSPPRCPPILSCDSSEPDTYSWDPIMTPTRFIIDRAPVRKIRWAHSFSEDEDEEDSKSRDGDDEESEEEEEEEENKNNDTKELRDKVEAAMSTSPAPQACCTLHYHKRQTYPVILDDDSDPDAFRGFKTRTRTRSEWKGRFYSQESCSESCFDKELAEKKEQVVILAYPFILDDDWDPEAFRGFKTLSEPGTRLYTPESCSGSCFDEKEKEEQEQVVLIEKDEPEEVGEANSGQENMGRNDQNMVGTNTDQENVDDDEEEDEENDGCSFELAPLPLSPFPSNLLFGKCQVDTVITDDDSDPDAFASYREQRRQRVLNPPSVDLAPVIRTKKSLTAAEQLH